VVAMCWEGPGAVAIGRSMLGPTNPGSAPPGTIRGDFAVRAGRNVIHGSDSAASGERELALWFAEDELVDWQPCSQLWVTDQ
jgi:nucleoside-diphosphate kinase